MLVAAVACAQPCDVPAPTLRHRGPVDDSALWPRYVRHAVACFDPVDGNLLLVAMSAAGDRTELWEWNGFRWRLLQPLDGITPPPLANFAATFHEGTGRVVIFGGTLPSGADSNRTWLWNGGFWDEPFFPDTPPAPIHAATFAYVHAIESAVLFGGIRDGTPVADTWTWGLGGWRRRADGPGPQAAQGRFVGFPDAAAAVLVNPAANPALDGTWHFSTRGWERVSWLSPPAPDAGLAAPTGYDPAARAIVRLSHGGPVHQTQRWTWQGTDETWTFDRWMSPSLPAVLVDVTTTSDPRRKRLLVLGRRHPDAPLELWDQDWTPGGLAVSAVDLSYGANCNATVLTSGDAPLTFQWLRDGAPIRDDATFEGAQTPSLAMEGFRLRCEQFRLSCRVCGPCGCAESHIVVFRYPFLADFNVDGGVDGADVESFLVAWETADPGADVNCDGGVDGADIEAFFRCWTDNCDR